MSSIYSIDTAHALSINQKRLTIQIIADFLLYSRRWNIPIDAEWVDYQYPQAFQAYSNVYMDRIHQIYQTTEFFSGVMFAEALSAAKNYLMNCDSRDRRFLRCYTEFTLPSSRNNRAELEMNVALVYKSVAQPQ